MPNGEVVERRRKGRQLAVGLERGTGEANAEHARDCGSAQLRQGVEGKTYDARDGARSTKGAVRVDKHALKTSEGSAVLSERLGTDVRAILKGIGEIAGERIVEGQLARNFDGVNQDGRVVIKDFH